VRREQDAGFGEIVNVADQARQAGVGQSAGQGSMAAAGESDASMPVATATAR